MSLFAAQLRDRQLELIFEDRATRNSFSVAAATELTLVLDQYSGQFDVLLFKARGRVFCSGGNLTDYAKMTNPGEGLAVNREIEAALKKLALLPVPTFCFVDGDVFGGGVEVLSAFDFVYTAPHVMIGLWQRRIGLTFGWGGGARLERRLGEKRLIQLSLTTESLSAQQSRAIGLTDGIYLDGFAEAIFEREFRRLSALPLLPITALKRWVASDERAIFEGLWWKGAHRGALSRFVDRQRNGFK